MNTVTCILSQLIICFSVSEIFCEYYGIRPPPSNKSGDGQPITSPSGSGEVQIQPRIASGEPAMLGDAPYHLQIRYEDEYLCGGSLVISPNGNQIVITSCNCMAEKKSNPQLLHAQRLTVYGGRIRRNGWHFYEQYQFVDRILCHPKWSRTPIMTHDIAVLQLSNEFEINRLVQPIPLPEYTEVYPTGYLIISGWGQTHHTSLDFADELQMAHVEIVDTKRCSKEYSTIKDRPLPKETFCGGKIANPTYQGACVGDEGSPGVAIANDTLYLAGIFSWGQPKCGNRYQPSIYQCVSFYLGWILQASWINQTRSDPAYYQPSSDVDESGFGAPGVEVTNRKKHTKRDIHF